MNLPRVDKEGIPYISYSQIKNWNEKKGFNTGVSGKNEFMMSYFFNQQFPDANGFGQFGTEVEDYICGKPEAKELFTAQERDTLDKIQPLGLFQQEIKIPFEGFYLKGFIDDSTSDLAKLRDYKTASEKSKAKYYEDDYNQLDLYALGAKQITGKLPKELEVCIIERLGNGFRGGRAVMLVGTNIWYVQRKTNKEKLEKLKQYIISTAKEIESYYNVWLKLNN